MRYADTLRYLSSKDIWKVTIVTIHEAPEGKT